MGAAWELFVEEDFRLRLSGIEQWKVDGIIAGVDDPAVAAALPRPRVRLVRRIPATARKRAMAGSLGYLADSTSTVTEYGAKR